MSAELQSEEREVLLSIYDGDDAFKQLSPTVFQYKYGEHDSPKSFLLELKWTENYPNEKPEVNMDTFYNRHLVKSIKDAVTKFIGDESNNYLGEAMTYSLFESVKENHESFLENQPENEVNEIVEDVDNLDLSQKDENSTKKAVVKKEQLSKAQKRKQWDRVECGKGEKPRGWDWIDVVKHLSQTGGKQTESLASS